MPVFNQYKFEINNFNYSAESEEYLEEIFFNEKKREWTMKRKESNSIKGVKEFNLILMRMKITMVLIEPQLRNFRVFGRCSQISTFPLLT
jgi:hypothetical protein